MSDNKVFISVEAQFIRLEEKIDALHNLLENGEHSPTNIGDWIPEKDAKRLLGLSTTSLWKLRTKGQLEFSKPNNSTVYYKKESILNWINSNSKEAFSNPQNQG